MRILITEHTNNRLLLVHNVNKWTNHLVSQINGMTDKDSTHGLDTYWAKMRVFALRTCILSLCLLIKVKYAVQSCVHKCLHVNAYLHIRTSTQR